MFFCSRNFKMNAPSYVKKHIPKSHLEALEGKKVDFDKEGLGTAHYDVEGTDRSWYLYPIERSWCSNERQESLLI